MYTFKDKPVNFLKGRDFLKLLDLTPCEISELIDLAADLKEKKKSGRFPNVAGFCRNIGIGGSEYARLSKKYPEEFEKLACILEDEALNSEISPTLLGAYLKRRLGYDDSARSQKNDVDVGQLKLIFEHDILADGE